MTTKSMRRNAFRTILVSAGLTAALATAGLSSATAAQAEVGTVGIPEHYIRPAAAGALLWTVPANTHAIRAVVIGAAGASGQHGNGSSGAAGGYGGVVSALLDVAPGQVLTLYPGKTSSGYGTYLGGLGGFGDGAWGDGGNGGSASMIFRGGTALVVAGGGGGGGGGGAVAGYDGGRGGDAQHNGTGGGGPGAGSGGSGNHVSASPDPAGQDGSTASSVSYAGGGGGGGAGWNGNTLGGGNGGVGGTYGGGGGGGGAGGQSFAVDPGAIYTANYNGGDGEVALYWTANVTTTSTLDGPASVPQGRSITFTDSVASAAPSGSPAPTGTVRFELVNIYNYVRTDLGTVALVNGKASLTMPSFPLGGNSIHAIYSGDDNYETSTSNFLYPNVTAPIKTLSQSPSLTAFGNQVRGTLATKTVTLTNTGSIAWEWTSANTNNAAVNMPAITCPASVAPGASCTVTISFQPSTLGAVSAAISLASNFGTITLPVTGTGVNPKPVVTALSPASGPRAGGTKVTVTGRNFIGVTAIKVGTALMTAVSCPTTTTCTGTTPAGTVGAKDITVVAPAGTSAVVTADRFTYL